MNSCPEKGGADPEVMRQAVWNSDPCPSTAWTGAEGQAKSNVHLYHASFEASLSLLHVLFITQIMRAAQDPNRLTSSKDVA